MLIILLLFVFVSEETKAPPPPKKKGKQIYLASEDYFIKRTFGTEYTILAAARATLSFKLCRSTHSLRHDGAKKLIRRYVVVFPFLDRDRTQTNKCLH
jgi:hypothetical protein